MNYYQDKKQRLRESRLRCHQLDDHLTRLFNLIKDLDSTIVKIQDLILEYPGKEDDYLSNIDLLRRSRGDHFSEHRKIAFELDMEFERNLRIQDEKQLTKQEINEMMEAREKRKVLI